MRRLLLAAVLLIAPTVMRADDYGPPPPTFYFTGCSNPVTGCVTGTMVPFFRVDDGWFYSWDAQCEACSIFRRLTAYDSQANIVYTYEQGNCCGGRPLTGTPTFGLVQTGPIFGSDGSFVDGPQTVPVGITTTPEPATFVLLSTGLMGAVFLRRRFA